MWRLRLHLGPRVQSALQKVVGTLTGAFTAYHPLLHFLPQEESLLGLSFLERLRSSGLELILSPNSLCSSDICWGSLYRLYNVNAFKPFDVSMRLFTVRPAFAR